MAWSKDTVFEIYLVMYIQCVCVCVCNTKTISSYASRSKKSANQ